MLLGNLDKNNLSKTQVPAASPAGGDRFTGSGSPPLCLRPSGPARQGGLVDRLGQAQEGGGGGRFVEQHNYLITKHQSPKMNGTRRAPFVAMGHIWSCSWDVACEN